MKVEKVLTRISKENVVDGTLIISDGITMLYIWNYCKSPTLIID